MSERDRFSRDVWWNVGALAVAGGAGILLNYLVSAVHGAAALGVFNQVFAVYIVLSQLGALGIHYSALRHLAAAADPRERQAIATSALLTTVMVGAVFAGAGWVLAGPIGRMMDSASVATGIRHAAPGVLFFALSKVTLACVNALERMRWYAVLSAGRFLLMILAFAGLTLLEVDPARLPLVITVAEGSLLLLSLVPIAGLLRRVPLAALGGWIGEHLRFGVKGFSSGLVAELNTRIDVLILGAFAGDGVVGAYSFAAILAEGLYQLLVVLRTNFAPIVIRLWAEGRRDDLVATVRRVRDRTYLGAAAAGALAVAGYALLVPFVTSDPLLADSWPYFAVLVAGMVASAGYAPFLPLLLYAGLPGWYTVLMIAVLGGNAIGNLALVPALGALGSALGTAIAFALGVVLLRAMSARLLEIRI
ncbi:MAG TPA: oligosaccharide flippase family protein [Kofleriaceae bacterium]|nr:oligosaccharide flippase family protein [Kofleriaceae bacterium]